MVLIAETETKPIVAPTPETLEEGRRTRTRRVKEVSAATGLPEADVERGLEEQARKKPFRVDFKKTTIDGPYYRPFMDGTQVVLEINIDHPWFQQLYSATSADQSELRSALELDLWARAIREIDAADSLKAFYVKERIEWSRMLTQALLLHPEVFNDLAGMELINDEDEPLVLDQPEEE